KLLAVLRAPTLLFYVFARGAQYRSRTGVAVIAAALAAGPGILGTHRFERLRLKPGLNPPWLVALRVAAIVGPPVWAALQWPGVARKIGAVLAVVVLALVVALLLGVFDPFTPEAWRSIAAASLGVLVLFLAGGFWPVRRRL